MQHFYGELKGRSKESATRVGTKDSGIRTRALTRDGQIEVNIWYDKTLGVNRFDIEAKVGDKPRVLIAQGIIDEDHLEFRAQNFNSKLGGFMK